MSPNARKTSARIWRPIGEQLDEKVSRACLRRDAFLNRVLREVELAALDSEVRSPNSEEANGFIAQHLDGLDRKLVTMTLESDVVDRLDDICARKRIVRDAFFNRLFFLLVANRTVVDKVFFEGTGDWRQEVWVERRTDSDAPFYQRGFEPLHPIVDPFWPIRTGLEIYWKEHKRVDAARLPVDPYLLYTKRFDDSFSTKADLYGLNCFMFDWEIPGHPENKRLSLDDLLSEPSGRAA